MVGNFAIVFAAEAITKENGFLRQRCDRVSFLRTALTAAIVARIAKVMAVSELGNSGTGVDP